MEKLERIAIIDEKLDNFQNMIAVLQQEIADLLQEKEDLEHPHTTIGFQYGKKDPKQVADDFGGSF